MAQFNLLGDHMVERRLGELSVEFGISIRKIALEQMKLFCRGMIIFTGGDSKKTWGMQKKAGQNAIHHDMNNLFIGDEDCQLIEEFENNYVKIQKDGKTFLVLSDARTMGKQEILQLQGMKRNQKGRVPKQKPTRYKNTTLSQKYLVRSAKLKQARLERNRHIGTLKAGWVQTLETLESMTQKPVSRVPAGIRKLKARAPQSGLIDNKSNTNVRLVSQNRVRYASRTVPSSDIEKQAMIRRKDMLGSAQKRMVELVDRYNKTG